MENISKISVWLLPQLEWVLGSLLYAVHIMNGNFGRLSRHLVIDSIMDDIQNGFILYILIHKNSFVLLDPYEVRRFPDFTQHTSITRRIQIPE